MILNFHYFWIPLFSTRTTVYTCTLLIKNRLLARSRYFRKKELGDRIKKNAVRTRKAFLADKPLFINWFSNVFLRRLADQNEI